MSNTAVVAARRIDEIGKAAMEAFLSPESFEKELAVAQAVADMRAVLTPEVMLPIMALMNTGLGFDTDRNPAKTPKDKEGNPVTPYAMEVVREVFIESRLRGFHTVGNEFNIIAGKFYGGLNGFERKVKTHPKVTDFKDFFSVPVSHGDKGAIVKARAEWRQDGVQQVLEREFAVRVNANMGADAVVGKAKRKLYAAVYSRLSGAVTPEGDTMDDVTELKGAAGATAATSAEQLFGRSKDSPKPPTAGAEPHNTAAHNTTTPSPASSVSPTAAPAASTTEETPQQALGRFLVESGVTFDSFRDFVRVKNLAKDADAWASFDEVPEKVCVALKNSPKTMAELVRKFGSVQK